MRTMTNKRFREVIEKYKTFRDCCGAISLISIFSTGFPLGWKSRLLIILTGILGYILYIAYNDIVPFFIEKILKVKILGERRKRLYIPPVNGWEWRWYLLIGVLYGGLAYLLNGVYACLIVWAGVYLFHQFKSNKLLSYERLVFDAWRTSLQKEAQCILDSQLKALRGVRHDFGGAEVIFDYNIHDMPLFKFNQAKMYQRLHVATVLLRAEGDKMLRAKIFIFNGRFSLIKFPKRPKRYMQQHHIQEQTLEVASVEQVK